jgi:peptide/nickel transport system substrate-binding protein
MHVMTGSLSRRAVLEGMGIGTLGLAGAALVGCGTSAPSNSGTTEGPAIGRIEGATQGGGLPMVAPKVEGKPKYGGTWRVAATSTSTQYDAHTALGGNVWHNISERLLEQHPSTGEVLPGVTKSWEVADPSGLTLIFKLDPGVKIHNRPPWNGRQFTAEDAAWNMERIGGLYAEREKIPLGSFQRASMVANIVKAEAIDPTTVKVTLSRPNSAFFNGLTENRVPMMPKEIVDIGFKDPMKFAGIGAFEISEWKTDQRQVFTKNPNYYRKGEPYFDTFERLIVPDTAATQAAFISGQTQVLSAPTSDSVALIRKAKPDANLYTTIDGNWKHMRPQVQDFAPFKDFRVRHAIHLAIDYADMGNGWYGDGWGYQASLSPGYPEAWKPDKVKALPGYNPDTKEKDRAEAQKLMAAAGYPNGKGIDFELMISGGATGESFDNSTRFQQQMSVAFPDMKITFKPMASSAEFAVPQAEGRFQLLAYTITCVPDPVLELISQYHTTGSRNYGKFSDKKFDDLLDRAIVELDRTKRTELLDQAQRMFIDSMRPMYVLYANARKEFLQSDIGGYDTTWGVWYGYSANLKAGRWYYVDK